MPIRHHNNIGEILPPFADNLVFWAPFTQGDLTDHVSGNAFQLTGKGSLVWDDVENAYKVTLPSTNFQCALSISGLSLGLTNKCTMVYSYKDDVSSNFRAAYFSANPPSDTYPYALFVCGGERGNANQWKKFVCTWDNGTFTGYKNGEIYLPLTISTSFNTECNSGISIGNKMSSSHFGSYWFKDYMIYDRVLTNEEIIKIYE